MQSTGVNPISNVTDSKTPPKPREISLLKEIAANCKQNIWETVRVTPEKGRKKWNPLNEQDQLRGSCWTQPLDRAGAVELLPLEFTEPELSPSDRDRNDFVFSLQDGELLALFGARRAWH